MPAAAETAVEKQHVAVAPDVCGGRPCVAGTRVRVVDVWQCYELEKMSVAEVIEQYPQLTPADVHAAMAYFWDHEAEIRRRMEEDDAYVEAMAKKHDMDRLRRRAEELGIEVPRR